MHINRAGVAILVPYLDGFVLQPKRPTTPLTIDVPADCPARGIEIEVVTHCVLPDQKFLEQAVVLSGNWRQKNEDKGRNSQGGR